MQQNKQHSLSNQHKILMMAGICALLSAVTTLLMGMLSVPYVADFDAQVQLANNSQYMASKWVLFLHPQLTFLSFTGLAVLYWRSRPELILPAMVFATIWAFSEALQQGLIIESLNNILRQDYLQASSAQQLESLKTSIQTISAISSGLFFVLLFAVGFAYMLLAICVATSNPVNYWLAAGMGFLTLTSFLSFSGYYLIDAPIILQASDFLFDWGYVWLAPLFRAYLGIWLIQQSRALKQPSPEPQPA